MKASEKITSRLEINREEIATVIYEELLSMAERIVYGSIGVNCIIHNGLISKVEFVESRKTRLGGKE